jgi:hypothetical protein
MKTTLIIILTPFAVFSLLTYVVMPILSLSKDMKDRHNFYENNFWEDK